MAQGWVTPVQSFVWREAWGHTKAKLPPEEEEEEERQNNGPKRWLFWHSVFLIQALLTQ